MNLDTERLIMEIQKRPAIWDTRLSSYSNRVDKQKAWEEICCISSPDFLEKSVTEKNGIALTLQKRWRSIKDSFNRERQRIKKISSGSEHKLRKQYIYYNILQFLQPLSELRPERQNADTHNQQNIIENEEEYRPEFIHPCKKKKLTPEEKLYDVLATNIINKKREEKTSEKNSEIDPDHHFLLSLYNDFKQIREDNKLYAKVEIMNVILKFKNKPSPFTPSPSTPSPSTLSPSTPPPSTPSPSTPSPSTPSPFTILPSIPSTSRQQYCSYNRTQRYYVDDSTNAALSCLSRQEQSNQVEEDTESRIEFHDSSSTPNSESLIEDMFGQ